MLKSRIRNLNEIIRLKGLLALAAGVLSLAMGTFGIAQAATATAAGGPSAYQTSTIAQALRTNPDGIQVAAGKAEWQGGSVVMVVPASPDDTTNPCPYSILTHWTCVYNRVHFRGTQLEFRDPGYHNLRGYGGADWVTRSWALP